MTDHHIDDVTDALHEAYTSLCAAAVAYEDMGGRYSELRKIEDIRDAVYNLSPEGENSLERDLSPKHVCKTSDGYEIKLGLRVIDYDNKVGMVTCPPRGHHMDDKVCWPCIGHNGHWWEVCSDRPGHVHKLCEDADDYEGCRGGGFFDGSRMVASPYKIAAREAKGIN